MRDLIEKVEKLGKKSDKQGLVKLGAEELGVDLDASKTSAILAEELLAVIEARGGSDSESVPDDTELAATEKEEGEGAGEAPLVFGSPNVMPPATSSESYVGAVDGAVIAGASPRRSAATVGGCLRTPATDAYSHGRLRWQSLDI